MIADRITAEAAALVAQLGAEQFVAFDFDRQCPRCGWTPRRARGAPESSLYVVNFVAYLQGRYEPA